MSSGYRFSVLAPWAQCALIVVLSLIGLGQVLDFAFLNLDDHEYVLNNPYVAQGLSPAGISWALTTFDNPYYMPLTRLSFLLDGSLFGLDPGGFHLSNLLLHIGNSLLVLALIRLLGFGSWIPLAVAALFAIHPQHLEAIAWVAERKELLSAFFGLLSLHCYVRFMSERPGEGLSPRGWLLLSLLCYLLSLLAKPVWVTLPVLLLLLDFWPLRAWSWERSRTLLLQKLPFLLLACVFTAIHAASGPGSAGYTVSTYGEASWSLRMGHAMVAWASYLLHSILPLGLSTYAPYPESPLPVPLMLASTATVLLITALALLQYRTRPYLLAGWAWFSLGLAPAIGIGVLELVGLQGIGEAVLTCMRFTYMPHIGLFLALCAGIHAWSGRSPLRQQLTAGGVVLVVLAFTAITRYESQFWRDSETFWLHSLSRSGEHQISYYNLGSHYLDVGRPADAIRALKRAEALDPKEPLIALFLGNAYRDAGQLQSAYDHYSLMLEKAPAPPDLLHLQALSFYLNGERELAETFRNAARSKGLTPEQEARNLAGIAAPPPPTAGPSGQE